MSRSSIYILNREKIQILDAREYVPPSEITVSNNGHLTIRVKYQKPIQNCILRHREQTIL